MNTSTILLIMATVAWYMPLYARIKITKRFDQMDTFVGVITLGLTLWSFSWNY